MEKKKDKNVWELWDEVLDDAIAELTGLYDALCAELEQEAKEDKEQDDSICAEKISADAIKDFMDGVESYVASNPSRVMTFFGDPFVSLADLKELAAGKR